MFTSIPRWLLVLLAIALISACGGGTDSSSDNNSNEEDPPASSFSGSGEFSLQNNTIQFGSVNIVFDDNGQATGSTVISEANPDITITLDETGADGSGEGSVSVKIARGSGSWYQNVTITINNVAFSGPTTSLAYGENAEVVITGDNGGNEVIATYNSAGFGAIEFNGNTIKVLADELKSRAATLLGEDADSIQLFDAGDYTYEITINDAIPMSPVNTFKGSFVSTGGSTDSFFNGEGDFALQDESVSFGSTTIAFDDSGQATGTTVITEVDPDITLALTEEGASGFGEGIVEVQMSRDEGSWYSNVTVSIEKVVFSGPPSNLDYGTNAVVIITATQDGSEATATYNGADFDAIEFNGNTITVLADELKGYAANLLGESTDSIQLFETGNYTYQIEVNQAIPMSPVNLFSGTFEVQ